jgi:hypothetical protein
MFRFIISGNNRSTEIHHFYSSNHLRFFFFSFKETICHIILNLFITSWHFFQVIIRLYLKNGSLTIWSHVEERTQKFFVFFLSFSKHEQFLIIKITILVAPFCLFVNQIYCSSEKHFIDKNGSIFQFIA